MKLLNKFRQIFILMHVFGKKKEIPILVYVLVYMKVIASADYGIYTGIYADEQKLISDGGDQGFINVTVACNQEITWTDVARDTNTVISRSIMRTVTVYNYTDWVKGVIRRAINRCFYLKIWLDHHPCKNADIREKNQPGLALC